jgi:hypothetical protein
LREVNEAVVATYLAGGNTRRLRGALAPLLKAAPLSKSAVSRVVGTLKAELEAWRTRSLAELDVFGLYLDAIALRVRSAGKEGGRARVPHGRRGRHRDTTDRGGLGPKAAGWIGKEEEEDQSTWRARRYKGPQVLTKLTKLLADRHGTR